MVAEGELRTLDDAHEEGLAVPQRLGDTVPLEESDDELVREPLLHGDVDGEPLLDPHALTLVVSLTDAHELAVSVGLSVGETLDDTEPVVDALSDDEREPLLHDDADGEPLLETHALALLDSLAVAHADAE